MFIFWIYCHWLRMYFVCVHSRNIGGEWVKIKENLFLPSINIHIIKQRKSSQESFSISRYTSSKLDDIVFHKQVFLPPLFFTKRQQNTLPRLKLKVIKKVYQSWRSWKCIYEKKKKKLVEYCIMSKVRVKETKDKASIIFMIKYFSIELTWRTTSFFSFKFFYGKHLLYLVLEWNGSLYFIPHTDVYYIYFYSQYYTFVFISFHAYQAKLVY